MDRLTIKHNDEMVLKELCDIDKRGNAEFCIECREKCGEIKECGECPIQACFNKLAEYEDTGLTPEEINNNYMRQQEDKNGLKAIEKILQTEYSEKFDIIRKKMMATSYHKYGSVKENSENPAYDFIESLEKRLAAFKKTKNTEYLADVANFCMMIYMFPEKHGCHYKSTDSNKSLGIEGISIQELKEL